MHPNNLCLVDLGCTKTLVPDGANGVKLNSKLPRMDAYPERGGFMRE